MKPRGPHAAGLPIGADAAPRPARAPARLHTLRVITREEADEAGRVIRERTGLKVSSVYNGE